MAALAAVPSTSLVPDAKYTDLLQRVLRIQERTKHRTGLLHDRQYNRINGLLPQPDPMGRLVASQSWLDARAMWRAQIASEQLQDFKVPDWRHLAIDPRDGAIVRGKGGLASTPHGMGQLYGLLLQKNREKPSGVWGVDSWHHPEAFSLAFDDCVMRSKRPNEDEMVFRTFVDPITGERALRAAVSGRHSGHLLDDLAVIERLDRFLSDKLPAVYGRGINETHGYAYLANEGPLVASLHWRNSETGCARIGFTGGVVLRFLDSVVLQGRMGEGINPDDVDTITDTRAVTLVDERTRTARNHTVARKGQGGRYLTEAERQTIANERIDHDMALAVHTAGQMVEQWKLALEAFPDGMDAASAKAALPMEVLADLVEETRGLGKDDKPALLKLLTDEKRLAEIPHGSAAHIAAAFAVLAARSTSGDEARRLQTLAGDWLMQGWKR